MFKIKRKFSSSYYEARKLPELSLQLVIAKLRNLIKSELLEHAPPGGSKWESPIVVLRTSNGDIRIPANYEIGVTHNFCLDSYPIPNVEVVLHIKAGMSVFTKIDL